MAVILIFASFLSAIVLIYFSEEQLRVAILKAYIIHGCLIFISTEGLSLTRSLDFAHIVSLWAIVLLINCSILYVKYSSQIKNYRPKFYFKALDRSSQISTIAVIVITSISLAIALIAPPNNWDSMTYHMPRVMHWIQNRAVAHYPTHNLRQISFPPGAAYIITHLQILSGSDHFANCVQWMAFVGSILGISLITKKLIGDEAQWISMLLCASLPMAIAQSATTQTDLVTAFWLVCFTYFLFGFKPNSKLDLFWLSASLSLAFATKPTALIYGVPLLLASGFILFKAFYKQNANFIQALFTGTSTYLTVSLGSLIFSIPNWLRNAQTFGQPLGIDMGTKSSVHSLTELLSVVLKNLALNIPVPAFNQVILLIHRLINVDINEPSLTWGNPTIPFNNPTTSPTSLLLPFEDTVASPIHLILGVVALSYILYTGFYSRSRQNKNVVILGAIIVSGYLIYCYLLKWQPWGNRLLLSLFILQTPITAYYLTSCFHEKSNWYRRLIFLLASLSILYALSPIRHPLIALPYWSSDLASHRSESVLFLQRQQIYFSGSLKFLDITYHKLVNTAVDRYHCRTIGLISQDEDWEYPLWVLLNEKTAGNFRLKHIEVKNESAKLEPEFPDSELCAIVWSTGKIQPINQKEFSQ
jgi:hypothetical protein